MHWTLDLFAHFRIQYATGLAVIGLLLMLLRMWRWAWLMLAFCLLNVWLIAPLYLAPSYLDAPQAFADQQTTVVRVLTQNVNTHHGDPQRVAQLLRDEQADVVALQEIDHRWLPMLDELRDLYPFRRVVPRPDNFGIALLSRWPFSAVETIYPAESLLPSIRADVYIGSDQLRVITTHPPPPTHRVFALLQQQILAAVPGMYAGDLPVIVMGDLNNTRWGVAFNKLLKNGGLADSATGYGVQPTWPMGIVPLLIPIDHVLYSAELRVLDYRTGARVGSDHRSVIVDLQWTDP